MLPSGNQSAAEAARAGMIIVMSRIMKKNVTIFAAILLIIISNGANAQNNQQIVDSLRQRVEDLYKEADTATIINALELHSRYLDNRLRYIADSTAFVNTHADKKPLFQGGDANTFSAWVNKNLKQQFDENKNPLQGRVTVSFTISETGDVTNVEVLRGVHPKLDKEAVRVVSSSPKWAPGTTNGKPIPVKYAVPVVFQGNAEALFQTKERVVYENGDAVRQRL